MIIAANRVWALASPAIGEVNAAITQLTTGWANASVQAAGRDVPLPLQMVGRTAVVSISGPMLQGPSWLSFYGFAVTGDIRRAVQQAAADSNVSEIMLRINSPGGSVSGIADLSDAVSAASRLKSVRAGVDGMMASAALHVGVQARTVSAGRGDIVGSIGTYAVLYDDSKLFEEHGIKAILVSSGGLKGQGQAAGLPITDEVIAETQRLVDHYTSEFVQAVATGRRLSAEQAKALATGQVWIGAEARTVGLIDAVQPFDSALAASQAQQAQMQRNRAALALADL